jgi:hypothetical protein
MLINVKTTLKAKKLKFRTLLKLQACSPKNIPVSVVKRRVRELVIGTTSDKSRIFKNFKVMYLDKVSR